MVVKRLLLINAAIAASAGFFYAIVWLTEHVWRGTVFVIVAVLFELMILGFIGGRDV